VILYELLTGRVPFEAEAVPELCLKVVGDPAVPPHDLRPEIPEALSHVVLRCLEKSPTTRFQTVAELVEALEPFCPESERGAADRISHVLRTAGASVPTPAADIVRSNPKVKTNVSWEGDSQLPTNGSRRNLVLFGGIAVVAVAAAVVVGLKIGGQPPQPAAQPPAPTVTVTVSVPVPVNTTPATVVTLAPPATTTITTTTTTTPTTPATHVGTAAHATNSTSVKPPTTATKDAGSNVVTAPPRGFND
jgi:serine/threonine-protein kinase